MIPMSQSPHNSIEFPIIGVIISPGTIEFSTEIGNGPFWIRLGQPQCPLHLHHTVPQTNPQSLVELKLELGTASA